MIIAILAPYEIETIVGTVGALSIILGSLFSSKKIDWSGIKQMFKEIFSDHESIEKRKIRIFSEKIQPQVAVRGFLWQTYWHSVVFNFIDDALSEEFFYEKYTKKEGYYRHKYEEIKWKNFQKYNNAIENLQNDKYLKDEEALKRLVQLNNKYNSILSGFIDVLRDELTSETWNVSNDLIFQKIIGSHCSRRNFEPFLTFLQRLSLIAKGNIEDILNFSRGGRQHAVCRYWIIWKYVNDWYKVCEATRHLIKSLSSTIKNTIDDLKKLSRKNKLNKET